MAGEAPLRLHMYARGAVKMPEERDATALNEHQARYLRVSCEYIDTLLGDIEAILNTSTSRSAFPRYILDLDPAQRRTIEEYVSRLRARLIQILDSQGIQREPPSIPASRAIHTTLIAIDIAAEELKPKHMRRYGDLSKDVAKDLNGIATELRSLVAQLEWCLASGGVFPPERDPDLSGGRTADTEHRSKQE